MTHRSVTEDEHVWIIALQRLSDRGVDLTCYRKDRAGLWRVLTQECEAVRKGAIAAVNSLLDMPRGEE